MARLIRILYGLLVATAIYTLYRFTKSSSSTTPSAAKICYTIEGFDTCPYYQRAKKHGEALGRSTTNILVTSVGWKRSEWEGRKRELQGLIPGAGSHRTSPFVWKGCEGQELEFIGGYTDFAVHPK